MRRQTCGGRCGLEGPQLASILTPSLLTSDIPMLALPKKRPLLVEDDGGGGFWICDACTQISLAIQSCAVEL